VEWIELDRGEVEEHGSVGLHMIEAARLTADTHVRVHIATIAPGGRIGRHPARRWQLFCAVAGAGWVSGEDAVRHPIAEGQSVLWAPEEVHESGSDGGMTVVMVQSDVRLPRGP
jgi:quercetin dioxygenase-like cupin family protein